MKPRALPLSLVILSPLVASSLARAELLSGENVVLASGDVVDGNLYVAGGDVLLRGEILGDAVVFGGAVTIDGHVHGDVLAIGGEIAVLGLVDGDVRTAGGTTSLTGPIGGDVVGAGGAVHLTGAAAGDAFFAVGAADVDAPVDGAVHFVGGELIVRSTVGDGIVAEGAQLTLENGARVEGDLWFTGEELVRRGQAVVTGETLHTPTSFSATALTGPGFYGWLQGLVGLSVFGLLWLLPFRHFAQRTMDILRAEPARTAGVGALAFLVAPFVLIAMLIAGAFFGGSWIALFAFVVAAGGTVLALPVVAALLGRELLRARMRTTTEAVPMIIMLASLAVLRLVPIVGGLLTFIVILFGVGALVRGARSTYAWARAANDETNARADVPAAATQQEEEEEQQQQQQQQQRRAM